MDPYITLMDTHFSYVIETIDLHLAKFKLFKKKNRKRRIFTYFWKREFYASIKLWKHEISEKIVSTQNA